MQKPDKGCGKQIYPTSHEARMAIAQTKKRAKKRFRLQREYWCSFCPGWHLTSMTKEDQQNVRRKIKRGLT